MKNVFEMLTLQVPNGLPRGVCGKNNPCWLDCYIGTCSKKIQSEILIQIKTLLRATFKNC